MMEHEGAWALRVMEHEVAWCTPEDRASAAKQPRIHVKLNQKYESNNQIISTRTRQKLAQHTKDGNCDKHTVAL
jgi:hypothetical protein